MGKIYGYCKSIEKFGTKEQLDIIKKHYKEISIIIDNKNSSDNLEKLLEKLNEKDTVVFFSISIISKDFNECFETYKKLYKNGIKINFIKERYLSTEIFKDINDENSDDLVISIIKNQIELEFKKYDLNDSKSFWINLFLIIFFTIIVDNLLYRFFGIMNNQNISLTIVLLIFFMYYFIIEKLEIKKYNKF